MARQGLSQTSAAEQAGLSRQDLSKSLKQAEVQAVLAQARQNLIAESDNLRARARGEALEAALHLLRSTDEKIKARMIEFLAATDGKGPALAVHIYNRQPMPVEQFGYSYRRPEPRPASVVQHDAGSPKNS